MKLAVEGTIKIRGKNEPRPWSFNGQEGISYTLAVDNEYHGDWGADTKFRVPEEIYRKAVVGVEYALDAYVDTERRNGLVINDIVEV